MTIQDLQQRLANKYGKVRKANGGWLRIACPTCNAKDSKKMKRFVSTKGDHSHCFICRVRLQYFDLLGDQMLGRVDFQGEDTEEDRKPDPRSFELPCYSSIPVDQLPKDHPAVKFLYADHLYNLERYAKEYGIVYCPFEGGKVLQNMPFITSSERLIFPVKYKDKLVGWQTRVVPGTFYGDNFNKVKYHHIFNKGDYLFNYDNAKKYKMVVVVEGVKKALKFPNGVATFGTGISRKQNLMLREWKDIVVMMDAEDHNGTQKMANEMVDILKIDGYRAINVDLRKYNAVSPDEVPEDDLACIVYDEWTKQYGAIV